MRQEAVEQRHIAAGAQRQMQIGLVGRRGPARIEAHDPHGRVLLPRSDHALVQHRMAPRGIRSDEDDEVGELQVLVVAGDDVLAEGALVAGDARGHAQARVGVDIGGADEALHQLVGDVVVLGQELPRHVEGHGIRPVIANDLRELARDPLDGGIPVGFAAVDDGAQQPRLEREGLAQGRPLRAEPAEIGRMRDIAGNRSAARRIGPRHHAAADTAIGAGGLDLGGHAAPSSRRSKSIASVTCPFSTRTGWLAHAALVRGDGVAVAQIHQPVVQAGRSRAVRARCPATAVRPCADSGRRARRCGRPRSGTPRYRRAACERPARRAGECPRPGRS